MWNFHIVSKRIESSNGSSQWNKVSCHKAIQSHEKYSKVYDVIGWNWVTYSLSTFLLLPIYNCDQEVRNLT